MSLTTTILRKDIRQYRILIGLLTGLLAVLLAVGVRFIGHASSSTPTSRIARASRPRVESFRPAMAITGFPRRAKTGSRRSNSSVSPL